MKKKVLKVVKSLLPGRLFRLIEPKYHLLQALVASLVNGRPARSMKFIGVTGTNGKTTTSFMIHKILTEAGIKTGLMTTVAYGVGDDIIDQKEHITTLSAPDLQARLAEFKQAGVEWVVLETTSHALAQHRVFDVPFDVAVMTNITHEHLDYHGTFERYAAAKAKLLKKTARRGGTVIINADDRESIKVATGLCGVRTYGVQQGDVRAQHIKMEAGESSYAIELDSKMMGVHCRIPGMFNVYNSLAAILAALAVGVDAQSSIDGLARLSQIKGRMNTVEEGQPFNVLVDFAHTPDAFERLLGDLRKHTKGKLVAVFGSAGRRDKMKRMLQGEIAGHYCDEVVLTEEDDRDVDGNEILEQIATGVQKSKKIRGKNLFLLPDRRQAIQFAMSRVSAAGDTVILLGKGHEKTIERADGPHPWDEISEAKQAIRLRLEPKKE